MEKRETIMSAKYTVARNIPVITPDEWMSATVSNDSTHEEYNVRVELFIHPYTHLPAASFLRWGRLEGMVATVKVMYEEEDEHHVTMIHYDPMNDRYADMDGLQHLMTKEGLPVARLMPGKKGEETPRLVLKETKDAWSSTLEDVLDAPAPIYSVVAQFIQNLF